MMSGTLLAAVAAVLLLAPLASDAQNADDDRVRHTASLFLAELGDLVLDADAAFERLTAPKVAFEERLVQAPRDLFWQGLFGIRRRMGETAPQDGSVSSRPSEGTRDWISDRLGDISDLNVILEEAQRTSPSAIPRRSIGMPPEGRDHYPSTLHGRVSEEPSYEELNVNPLQRWIGESQGSVSMSQGGTRDSRLRISDWLGDIADRNVIPEEAQRTSPPAAPRRSIGMPPERRDRRYPSTLHGRVSEEPSYEELNVNPLHRRIGETQGSVSMSPGGTRDSRLRITDRKVIREAQKRSPDAPRRSIGMPEDHYHNTLPSRVSEELSYEEVNVSPLLKEEEDETSRFFWTT